MHIRKGLGSFRRATLPLALCSLLGASTDPVGSQAAVATTFTVQNCSDNGAGSLRQILTSTSTLSGSVVDLSHLTCSTISLDDGGIYFNQTDLTIVGPGRTALTIKPGLSTGTGLLVHTGSGGLTISGLQLKNGLRYSASTGYVKGGCVYSHGNLVMSNVEMDGCSVIVAGYGGLAGGCAFATGNISADNSYFNSCVAYSPHDRGHNNQGGGCLFTRHDISIHSSTFVGCRSRDYGGTIYAGGRVSLDHSVIAQGNVRYKGGGVYAHGGFDCSYSSIHKNFSSRAAGGVWTNGDTTIESCLFTDNFALSGAAVLARSGSLSIVNSTVSGNTATIDGAAIYSYVATLIANSTIVNNSTITDDASGVSMRGANRLTLQGAIVAHNGNSSPYATVSLDISGEAGTTIAGANNVVMNSPLALPAGTIMADPLLGPLRNNGGPTQTHSLLRGSPAINAGNNAFPRPFDQRGSPYRRVLGTRQDIGAFESDPDQIFADRFE